MFNKLFRKKENNEVKFNSFFEVVLISLPHLVGLIFFVIYPVVNAFIMAFKNGYKLSGAYSGVGVENFAYLFKDELFYTAVRNTMIYTFTVVPIATCISIVLATLLNQKIKGMAFFQTAYFLPMVTSTIAIGAAWKCMFNYNYGIVNYFLGIFGVDKLNWLASTNGSTALNLVAIIIFGVWNMIPFTIIILLSGLQNIDPLYYTASEVDGANIFHKFFYITLPLLTPTIFLTLVINMIKAFKIYKEIMPFWNERAGYTGTNLYTLVFYIKQQFFVYHKLGYAAAASVVLFVILFIFNKIQSYLEHKINQ